MRVISEPSSRGIIPRAAVNDAFLLMMPRPDPQLVAGLYANLSTIPFDYCARQKGGGINLNYFTMRQFPALQPSAYGMPAPWKPSIRDSRLAPSANP